MTCPNCQKEIASGSKFCYNCGAKQPETAAPGIPPQPGARKRWMRSSSDKMIAGVCGGLADYFDLDPTLIRIIWVLAFFCAGTGLLAYIILWIVLPLSSSVVPSSATTTS
jgi:phage shock protein PspC (stress-responsive transcriptional regulator)